MKRIIFLTAILTMTWVTICHSQMSGSSGSSSSFPSSDTTGVSSQSQSGSSGSFGSTSNPSSSSDMDAGARGSDMGGSSASAAATTDYNAAASIKISRMGEKAPAGMNSIAQGEITDIDRTQNKVTVKDSRTGSSIRYTINDQKELKDLNQGDRVQIFSEANQAK